MNQKRHSLKQASHTSFSFMTDWHVRLLSLFFVLFLFFNYSTTTEYIHISFFLVNWVSWCLVLCCSFVCVFCEEGRGG